LIADCYYAYGYESGYGYGLWLWIIMLQGEENPDNPLQRTIVGPRAGPKTL
jgi:hypothetical protein